jgi:RNA polymerase sigma-B factor
MPAYVPPVPCHPAPQQVVLPSLASPRRRDAPETAPLRRRNALVQAHLPLVRSVVGRFAPQPSLSYDDLVQVGSLGLIRAVEAFDPQRAVSFSSFAVPYIRGALLHELRDRQPMVRLPRSLWDLRQQASRLQEQRRQGNLAPLPPAALAAALGCGPDRLEELEGLRDAARPRSLDAPLPHDCGGEGGSGGGACLLDRLADPRSLAADEGPDGAEGQAQGPGESAGTEAAERAWLRQRLAALDPQRRALLEGRLRLGGSWVELGRQLGIHPRMAQRRCDAALAELQQAARAWRDGGDEGA